MGQMKQSSLVIIFFSLVRISCFSQDINLLDHAVCFSNGTHIYSENGKFGFKNFAKRLSEPIYDTIFHFGSRYCVVKQNDRYFILGEELESRFNQPIVACERRFEDYIWKLKVTTEKAETREYWVDFYWSSPRKVYPESDPFKFYSVYQNQPYSGYKLLQDNDPKNYLSTYSPYIIREIWIDSVRHKDYQDYSYLKTGEVVVRPNSAPFDSDYLGRYIMLYNSREKEMDYIVDIKTGDTLLKLTGDCSTEILYYEGQPFFSVQERDNVNKEFRWSSYDMNGKLISSLESINYLFYEGGRIYERLPDPKHGKYSDKGYSFYNVYRFRDAQPLQQNIIGIENQSEFHLFRSSKAPVFYVYYSDSLIGEIKLKKQERCILLVEDEEDTNPPENRLVSITTLTNNNDYRSTHIYSTKTGYYQKFKGQYNLSYDKFYKTYKIYYSDWGTKNRKVDIERMGIYREEMDSIVFFPENQRYTQVGPNTLIKEDSMMTLVDFDGNSLSNDVIEDYTDFEVDDRKYFALKSNGVTSLYDENFKQVCEDCSLFEIRERTNNFTTELFLFKTQKDSAYRIVDKNLEAVLNKSVLSAYLFQNVLIVLNPDYTIEYLPANSFIHQ